MKNVTITLDAETVRWARQRASEREISLSRFVGDLLHATMQESGEYESAMRRYLAKQPVVLKSRRGRYPSRDELHER